MTEKIELFNMILARNEIVRTSLNAYKRYSYYSKRFVKKKVDDLEKLKDRALLARATKEKQFAFTKKHYKRRRELCASLKTVQYKNASNKIERVAVDGKWYVIDDMKFAIQEYEIEQILLGE